MRTVTMTLLAALIALGAVTRVQAQCTTREDANDTRRTTKKAARCNDKVLRSGPGGTCIVDPPPACSGSLSTDAIALAYGPNNPPTAAAKELSDQRRCQKQIGKGVADFVKKLGYIVKGNTPEEAELKARRSLDKLLIKCAIPVAADPVSGVVLPAVGPQCAAAIPAVGGPVDATALRDCLLTLMRTWVDRVVPNPQPLRPNILFILTDDQRWDTTDATHSPSGGFIMPRTRAELGDSGIEFKNGFMTTPLCCPSRSSILTGSFAHRTGVYKNGGTNGGADDLDDSSTIATWLQGAGYRTALFGKYLNGYPQLWDAATEPPYVPPGWTEWRGARRVSHFDPIFVEPDGLGGYHEVTYTGGYFSDLLREFAKTFISQSVSAGEPFFLYLSFKAPHLPQEPATRHEGMFQSIPPWRPPSYNETDVSDKPAWVQALPLQNSAQLDQIRIDQLEMLQAVDEAIGGNPAFGIVGIMEHLRNLGIADNTIVVYFADNGWYWGEHRLRAKNNPYEEAIRSPMFVRYPPLAPLKRSEDRFALNIDLAPTFAELAGAGVPILHDGDSLLRVLDGTQPTWRTDFLAESWPNTHPWALVHEGQWKYTEIPTDPGNPLTTFERELYDLSADPYELTNVASDPLNAARIATMAARLRQLRPNWPVDSDPNGPDPEEDE